jgi:hypothetical protein
MQHDVAMIAGQASAQALEALLIHITLFLSSGATISMWIVSAERRRGRSIRLSLEWLEFRVEPGAKCEVGLVLATRRCERNCLARVA